jgi:acylphosphatase
MLQTIEINISGRVQGVFYRQATKEKALELGIKGKVMNLDNGNVKIIATGTKEQLNKLADWCKTGPPRARVTNVDVQELPLQSFEDFSIVRFL